MFVSHPRLKSESVEDRPYQATLAQRVSEAPHLLVLPTGLGKTVVALRALLPFLDRAPEKRVLILAPTKPLVEQHARFLRNVLSDVAVAAFTGETSPAAREADWNSHRIIVATPQVMQNDVIRGARTLADVAFVVYDEAHRATGRYPYVFLAHRYAAVGGRMALGLTASPGNDAGSLQRVMGNLHLERVEVRSERDADVAPYVHDVATEWVRVRPTMAQVRVARLLERMYGRAVVALRRLGYFPSLRGLPGRKELVRLGHQLRAEAASRASGRSVFEAVSLQARALKLQHAIELAETQGSASTHSFLKRIELEATGLGGSKASRDLVAEPEFLEAMVLAREDPEPAPKAGKIAELVRNGLAGGHRRILVFANYRETADALVAALSSVEGARAHRFVGHARAGGEAGLTKREQQAIVDRFRQGDLNVLVATAVGEEGLDLPETDAVILHEPVPSGIRLVQRRGRTGRHGDGRLYVLLTEGTRDESYHWSAVRRERRMHGNLAALRRVVPLPSLPVTPPTPSVSPTLNADLCVTMDARESGSPLAQRLLERGVRLRAAALPTGDYAVSDRVLVERKGAVDFVASLKDGRLSDQLPRLGQAEAGILLVIGDPFAVASGIAPAALAGALAAAASDHGVSVVTMPDDTAAAEFLVALARRERRGPVQGPVRHEKVPVSAEGQLRFVLQGLPRVGPTTARRLLEHFGSIAGVCAASPESLADVEGIGAETARTLHEWLHRGYAPPLAPLAGQVQASVPALEGGQGPAR